MLVTLGSERLLASRGLDGKRVGVVCNPASIDHQFTHIADALASHPRARLAAIFGPQHGFRSDVQENMIETGHGRDDRRRVPLYSLYSETREPTAEMLEGLDVLVIDLQDVGTRIYTYIYTMAHCLTAAKRHGVKVLVCDRPNPIGGAQVEGPMLVNGFESFVGLYPIPMRHGMTIGELARLFNEFIGIGADLEVVPMKGWRRDMYHDGVQAPWVMPSPNIPTLDSAIAYPGTVLFEGTNVSEGRGTTRPFEQFGAPYLKSYEVVERLESMKLPGVTFRPCSFTPTFDKWKGQSCEGAFIHVTDAEAFLPLRTGVAVFKTCFDLGGKDFGWRPDAYEFVEDVPAFDLLCGTDQVRKGIESGQKFEALFDGFDAQLRSFEPLRQRYALYP
jgi:uncharacterized protein YbbC (DUF1343 family)